MEFFIICCVAIIVIVLFIKAPQLGDDDKEVIYRGDYAADGFLDPQRHPVALTHHARERMQERLHISDNRLMEKHTREVYLYGKSARQLNQSAAYRVRQIEQKEGSIVLLYRNYIYIFTKENALITLYENENIKL